MLVLSSQVLIIRPNLLPATQLYVNRGTYLIIINLPERLETSEYGLVLLCRHDISDRLCNLFSSFTESFGHGHDQSIPTCAAVWRVGKPFHIKGGPLQQPHPKTDSTVIDRQLRLTSLRLPRQFSPLLTSETRGCATLSFFDTMSEKESSPPSANGTASSESTSSNPQAAVDSIAKRIVEMWKKEPDSVKKKYLTAAEVPVADRPPPRQPSSLDVALLLSEYAYMWKHPTADDFSMEGAAEDDTDGPSAAAFSGQGPQPVQTLWVEIDAQDGSCATDVFGHQYPTGSQTQLETLYPPIATTEAYDEDET
ncbi:hypothetical protein AcW1_006505 [Taiwanofungus camphoratus]|nr:hypothetical protein AcV5_009091 [Antrodia cinnamomea]KAI0954703.1 hypothetical protein AcW1_006505 [Antrodia cinnamomea]